MLRNPKAERQRHRRWTQHTRGWAHYPFRGSYYRHMQKHFNRRERHQARIDSADGSGALSLAAEEPRQMGGLVARAPNLEACRADRGIRR